MDFERRNSEKIPSREEVVEMLRKFPQRGITNPDDLDRTDPEVIKAERILDVWRNQGQQRAKESSVPGANLKWSLASTTIYVDAGFHDPIHLEEVDDDWLGGNDLADAEELGLDEIAAEIRAKIAEIDVLLGR
jgi:hypothetical protein